MNTKTAYEVVKKSGPLLRYSVTVAKALGSNNASIFLSQIAIWESKGACPEKGVCKTREELDDELGMGRHEIDTVRRLLKERGILVETKQPWDGNMLVNRVYYRINAVKLAEFIDIALAKKDKLPLSEEEPVFE